MSVPRRYPDALREVVDPCCRGKGVPVVDMGLAPRAFMDFEIQACLRKASPA